MVGVDEGLAHQRDDAHVAGGVCSIVPSGAVKAEHLTGVGLVDWG